MKFLSGEKDPTNNKTLNLYIVIKLYDKLIKPF